MSNAEKPVLTFLYNTMSTSQQGQKILQVKEELW
jgi:hypothetical protein